MVGCNVLELVVKLELDGLGLKLKFKLALELGNEEETAAPAALAASAPLGMAASHWAELGEKGQSCARKSPIGEATGVCARSLLFCASQSLTVKVAVPLFATSAHEFFCMSQDLRAASAKSVNVSLPTENGRCVSDVCVT